MEKLTTSDCDKFLHNGILTQPFLDDDFVLQKVLIDFNRKKEQGKDITKIESLYNWMHAIVKHSDDSKFRNDWRFQRNAEEIWNSKQMTGCTDYATLFATFARQIGIPTTILHTAEYNWLIKLKNGEIDFHQGHSFCECFYDGKWILVDPTFRRIEKDYNSNKLILSYQVGPSNVYVPYFRGLDLGKRQNTEQHNREMDKICQELLKQSNQI